MVPRIVRHKREEMGLLVILPVPVVLATSTTILRRVGRVLLDLPMMAVFSVASLSITMSSCTWASFLALSFNSTVMYFTISSRLMRARMTCILSGSPRLHSTLLRRSNFCPMESPNTSTYTAFFSPNIRRTP